MTEDPQQPSEGQKPAEPTPDRRVDVKNSQGTVIGNFNTVVQNYLADPKMRYFLLGLAVLILASAAVLIWVIPAANRQTTEIALKTAILPTPSPTPKFMSGNLNVAVAEFSVIGKDQDPLLGRVVAETLRKNLQASLDELATAGDLGVVEVWGPEQTGLLDPADPVRSAQEFAHAYHVHIIIYGEIDASQRPVNITPHFYISDEGELYDSRELTGDHNLGAAITVVGEPLSAPFNTLLRDRMAPRARVLTLVIQALSFYAVHEYETALSVFSQTAPLPPTPEPGAPTATPDARRLPKEGREVIYLLAGNAAGKAEKFDDAARYFDLSLAENPDYARAMIGKAGVLYMKSFTKGRNSVKPSDIDGNMLDESIKLYNEAAAAADKPAGADVDTKVHFGLGQCRYYLVYTGREKYFDPAVEDFRAVTAAYDAGDEDTKFRLRDMAGISHGHLGLIYEMAARPDLARVEYEQALDLLKNSLETNNINFYNKRLAVLKAALTPTP